MMILEGCGELMVDCDVEGSARCREETDCDDGEEQDGEKMVDCDGCWKGVES